MQQAEGKGNDLQSQTEGTKRLVSIDGSGQDRIRFKIYQYYHQIVDIKIEGWERLE